MNAYLQVDRCIAVLEDLIVDDQQWQQARDRHAENLNAALAGMRALARAHNQQQREAEQAQSPGSAISAWTRARELPGPLLVSRPICRTGSRVAKFIGLHVSGPHILNCIADQGALPVWILMLWQLKQPQFAS